jgi:hypothetical protein
MEKVKKNSDIRSEKASNTSPLILIQNVATDNYIPN